jgi:hypothetical protein
MDRKPLTKSDLKDRFIQAPINRGGAAEYYEEGDQVFCKRTHKFSSELLVLRLGLHPVLKVVCVYWDHAP